MVVAEAPGGFPVLLAGRCARCGDRFVLLSPPGAREVEDAEFESSESDAE